MTSEETALVELLGKCFNAFNQLPTYHLSDSKEFAQAIHVCQNIVFARDGMRDYGYKAIQMQPVTKREYNYTAPYGIDYVDDGA